MQFFNIKATEHFLHDIHISTYAHKSHCQTAILKFNFLALCSPFINSTFARRGVRQSRNEFEFGAKRENERSPFSRAGPGKNWFRFDSKPPIGRPFGPGVGPLFSCGHSGNVCGFEERLFAKPLFLRGGIRFFVCFELI